MAGSRRRRQLQRQRDARPPDFPLRQTRSALDGSLLDRLPPELLSEIHGRLTGFLDRLAFAASCSDPHSQRRLMTTEAPCLLLLLLLLPGSNKESTATLFSLADGGGQTATVRAPPADAVVVGSSGGWLVTAHAQGRKLRMSNPVTGARARLPDIATIPLLRPSYHWRFGSKVDDIRKVVLSESPLRRSYAAMLIFAGRHSGAPAFVKTERSAMWRMAPCRGDGVEDAVHHNGRFYSISYSGVVEAWEQHANNTGGLFLSRAVIGPRLPAGDEEDADRRKYLAVAPDGRLMAVLKDRRSVQVERHQNACVFTVHVLDEARGQWEEATTALFVGVNTTLCVSTKEYPGIRAGCVYYSDDESSRKEPEPEPERNGAVRSSKDGEHYELQDPGVYSLKDGTVERVQALPRHPHWPPPVWFTPSM